MRRAHLLVVLSSIVHFLFPASPVSAGEKKNSLLILVEMSLTFTAGQPVAVEGCGGVGYQRVVKDKYITSLNFGACPVSRTLYLSGDFLAPLGSTSLALGPVVQLLQPASFDQNPQFAGGLELMLGPRWYHPSILVVIAPLTSGIPIGISAVWSPTFFDW